MTGVLPSIDRGRAEGPQGCSENPYECRDHSDVEPNLRVVSLQQLPGNQATLIRHLGAVGR